MDPSPTSPMTLQTAGACGGSRAVLDDSGPVHARSRDRQSLPRHDAHGRPLSRARRNAGGPGLRRRARRQGAEPGRCGGPRRRRRSVPRRRQPRRGGDAVGRRRPGTRPRGAFRGPSVADGHLHRPGPGRWRERHRLGHGLRPGLQPGGAGRRRRRHGAGRRPPDARAICRPPPPACRCARAGSPVP